MSIRVSVVVPTYRRPALLRRTLVALLGQDFPAGEYEIIVCEDGADRAAGDRAQSETETLIEEVRREAERSLLVPPAQLALSDSAAEVPAGSRTSLLTARPVGLVWLAAPDLPAIRYIRVGGRAGGASGPAAARNAGWRAAEGCIIAFTDDDCLPAPGWLSAGAAALEQDARLAGVMGHTLVPLPAEPTDYELTVTGLERSAFITANCFYRRDALAAVGGFDERFRMAWREDSDLFFTLLDRYGTSAFRKELGALVVHPVRPAPWGVSLGLQRRARFNALLYKKHRGRYRARLAPVTPWHYYGIVGSFGLACGAVAVGQPHLALLGTGLWLVQTARFAVGRLQHTAKTPGHIADMVFTSLLIPFLSLYWRWRGSLEHRVLFF